VIFTVDQWIKIPAKIMKSAKWLQTGNKSAWFIGVVKLQHNSWFKPSSYGNGDLVELKHMI